MDKIDMNRNRIVTVWKRPILGEKENPEYSFEDEWGYHPCMETIWGDFEKVKMTYEELCYDLGFNPDVNFVDVTRAGSITYTLGKPNEISALFRAVHEKGYKQKSNGRKQGGK